MSENPFTRVYRGAITKNELGKVNIDPFYWVPEYVDTAMGQAEAILRSNTPVPLP